MWRTAKPNQAARRGDCRSAIEMRRLTLRALVLFDDYS
jgi:hypothetical protein